MRVFVESYDSTEVLFEISNGAFSGTKGDTLYVCGKGTYEVTEVQHVFGWSSGLYNHTEHDNIDQVSIIVKVKKVK